LSIFNAIQRLNTPGTVPLESSGDLAMQVGAHMPYHVRPVPELYSGRAGYATLPVRPLILLGALGEVTAGPLTPAGEQLYVTASWAILRYLHAFDGISAQTGELCLHVVTDNLRHHRRQLFSEDFGIAIAVHALRQHLPRRRQPPSFIDADWKLKDLVDAGEVTWTGPRRPDYLGWCDSGTGRTFLVLECKGCSSSRAESIAQLRDGLGQAVSVRSNFWPTRHFVIGTVVSSADRRIFAHAVEVAPQSPPVQVAPEATEVTSGSNILYRAHQASLLRLVGAHAEAAKLLDRDEQVASRARSLHIDGEAYMGITLPVPASDSDGVLTVALRASAFTAAAEGSRRLPDKESWSRALASGKSDDWQLTGSEQPLPEKYLAGPWASITSARQRQDPHEETVTQDLPPAVWPVMTAEGQAAVETIDGLRIQLAPADDSELQ
jgi:hypothetical protein